MSLIDKVYTAKDMRAAAKCLFACEVDLKHDNRDISRMLRQAADMMDREVGNSAAMHKALVDVYNTLEQLNTYSLHINDISTRRAFISRICHAKNVVDFTLSAPPRNCDIGTAEEQEKRYLSLCDANKCSSCPVRFKGKTDCVFTWEQMPYEDVEG